MAAREWTLQNYNRPVDSLLDRDLILDPAYQRGSVWTDDQRRQLILSIIEGLPIGAVFINERSVFDHVVVDGKQRIETLRKFADGEFAIPRAWVPEELVATGIGGMDGAAWIIYAQTDARWQRHFRNFTISTYHTSFKGKDAEEAERELFDRINFGGTPHPTPQATATYRGVHASVFVEDHPFQEGKLRIRVAAGPDEALPNGLDYSELYSVVATPQSNEPFDAALSALLDRFDGEPTWNVRYDGIDVWEIAVWKDGGDYAGMWRVFADVEGREAVLLDPEEVEAS